MECRFEIVMLKFIIFIEKSIFVLAILTVIMLSGSLSNSAAADDLKKIKRLVARVQLELSQIKEQSLKSDQQQLAFLEPQNEKIENLEGNNVVLTDKISKIELRLSLIDEKLEKYAEESADAKVSELNKLATVLALISIGDGNSAEPLILELVNKGNNVKKDLLILLLAETQKKQGLLEQSLGYYGALIADYPKSPYLNRSIFEAGRLLGELGFPEKQKSMLQALKESEGTYGIKARKLLE